INISQHVTREQLLVAASLLFVYQSLCLLLGGRPLALSPTKNLTLPSMPTPEEVAASRAWLRARQAGLLAAMCVWWTLSYLLTPGFLTPGSIWAGKRASGR